MPEEMRPHSSEKPSRDSVTASMGRIPTTGEEVKADGWLYRVVDMDGLRIDKIEVSRLESGRE